MSEQKIATVISIDGESRDSGGLFLGKADRKFRDAWTFEGDAVVLDPEKMKPRAQQLINEWRDEEKYKPIEVNGVKFSADPESVNNIDRAMLGANIIESSGQVFSIEWSDYDNNRVTLNKTQLAQLGLALMARTDQIYVVSRKKKEKVDSAKTAEEIYEILKEIGK